LQCNKKKKDSYDDNQSVACTQSSVSKLQKEMKNLKKKVTTVNIQLEQLQEATSDISVLESEEDLHFQFQFTQDEPAPKFELRMQSCLSKLLPISRWTSRRSSC